MEISALRAQDDRSRLQCGDESLDRFFRQFAGQNQFRHHIGVTYVAVDGDRVYGFATVAPAEIEIDRLPAAAAGKLPHYPLPVLRLARLGVDQRAQGQGVGKQLLRYTLELATRMADEYGCLGVLVDAKPEALAFYQRYGFVACEAVAGESDARPRQTPMFLGMSAIKAAIGTKK